MGQSCRVSQSSTITIMKMFVVLALVAAACAEPEADPALVYSSVHSPLLRAFSNVPALTYNSAANTLPLTYNTAVNSLPATYSHDVATPFVRAVAPAVAPAVTYKTVSTPALTYNTAAVSPLVYAQHQVASHTVTNYNSPTHYTAVSNGVFGPKYIAKNGPVQHIVKREADAEADADADALVYTLPYNTAVNTIPVTYNHAVNTPVVNSALHHGVVAPSVYNAAFNHVVATPSIYNAAPHAVAVTPQGLTHSSNVGVCTNNMGAVVPC